MNDLFRRDPPRMSDEEDRRTWERVRTAATRPAPWWSALWARPAVRFGLPAVAVVLVAVVWIAVEQPASTHRPARQSAALEKAPGGDAGAPSATATPEHEPTSRLLFVPSTVTAREPAAEPAPRDLNGLQKKFAEAPAQKQVRLHDEAAAGKSSANAPGGSIDEKEEKAQAAPEVTALRAGVRESASPAPTAPARGAPAAAGNALAPKDKASRIAGSTFGAVKQPYQGDSLALDARGGRADQMAYDYLSSTTLQQVGPLVTHRPLHFTAPLPVVTSAGAKAPETARIELSAAGVVSARIVDGAASKSETPVEGAPGAAGQTYARFEDAGPAEQILLVAYAADRMAGGAPPSLVQRLLVQAQRLEARDDDEKAAAKALLARLRKKNWGGAAWR